MKQTSKKNKWSLPFIQNTYYYYIYIIILITCNIYINIYVYTHTHRTLNMNIKSIFKSIVFNVNQETLRKKKLLYRLIEREKEKQSPTPEIKWKKKQIYRDSYVYKRRRRRRNVHAWQNKMDNQETFILHLLNLQNKNK